MPRTIAIIVVALLLSGCVSAVGFADPLPKAGLRPTPLRFGLYVTPERNPIQPPERFTGYHVGTDFEVTSEELESEVPVFSICSGVVLYGGFASGYGGLVVQRCESAGEPIIVIYGHLSLANLPERWAELSVGEQIGTLAPARSHDSDDNRKHLHLGIHRGENIDERGYVQTPEEISDFMDPLTVLPYRLAGTGGLMEPYWKTQ